jgi:hypothetical protein
VANIPQAYLFDVTQAARDARGGWDWERAIIEFDPRNSYIRNAWMGSDLYSTFNTAVQTDFGLSFDLDNPYYPVKGAAFVNGRLILSSQLDYYDRPGRGGLTDQIFVFNPEAGGSDYSPHVTKIETNLQIESALAEPTLVTSQPLPAPKALTPDTFTAQDLDLSGVNELFAKIAYSQQALDSGVARRVFETHFLQTSMDASQCRGTMLFTDELPARLQANVDRQNGFGRTAVELRSMVGTDHACAEMMASPPPPPPRPPGA